MQLSVIICSVNVGNPTKIITVNFVFVCMCLWKRERIARIDSIKSREQVKEESKDRRAKKSDS